MKLEIALTSERVAPGQEVTGRVRVVEGGASRSLTLTTSFCERSPGYLSVAHSDSAVLHEGELATGQDLTFRFVVPQGAPPSFKGKNGELFWQVEAVSDQRGLDRRAAHTFEVRPL